MTLQKHRQKKKEKKYKSPGSPHKGETAFSTAAALSSGQGKKDAKKVKQLIKKLGKKAFMTMVRLGSAELALLGINKKGGKVK